MVAYYRTARKPIPRHVWAACLGWEAAGPVDVLPLHLPAGCGVTARLQTVRLTLGIDVVIHIEYPIY